MRAPFAPHAGHSAAPHRRVGIALSTVGLVADGAVGLAILRSAAPWVLWVHLLAVLIWAEGISRMEGSSLRYLARKAYARMRRNGATAAIVGSPLNGRTVAFCLIGLLLFPGVGTLGIVGAVGLAGLRMLTHRQRPLPAFFPDAPPAARRNRPSDPVRDLAIEPLVDILREPENAMRHAAVRLLGRRCDRESVALLRGLLGDLDPDIRSEASTTLFNFEDKLNRALNETLERIARDPLRAAPYADLAAAYREFVRCGLLDGPSAHLYLTQACAAYQEATALEPDRADYWIALADVQNDLDDTAAASRTIAHACILAPDNIEANLLAITLAFREERWGDVMAFSASAQQIAPDRADLRALFDWWAEAPAESATAERRAFVPSLALASERGRA